MSGASSAPDPIEAAEAEIAGSKNLIAAVADDLSQQERWFAHYRVAEKRHARQRKFQETIYRLELGCQRLVRWSRRLALTSLRWARAGAAFLWRTAVALFVILRRTVTACAIWIRPRAYALAPTLRRLFAAFWAWAGVMSGALARTSLKGASIGSWWLAAKSQALASVLHGWLSTSAAWTRATAQALARASLATASAGFSWAVLNVRRISLARKRAERQTDTGH